jgi:hypothetical protein
MFARFAGIGVGHFGVLVGGRIPALVIETQDNMDEPTDEDDDEEQEGDGRTADLAEGEVDYMDVEEDEVEDYSEEDEEDSGASDCSVSDSVEEVGC